MALARCDNCGCQFLADYSLPKFCPQCQGEQEKNHFISSTQAIKSDNGKSRLDLVPLEVLEPLAEVREFALGKYGESGIQNWAQIEDERYLAALLRHLVVYQKNHNAVDEESGLPAIYHVLCNAAFLAIKQMRLSKQFQTTNNVKKEE